MVALSRRYDASIHSMEKEVKMMLEMEGRVVDELDRRKNARALMEELIEHLNNNMANNTTQLVYVPEDTINYDNSSPQIIASRSQ